MSRNKVMKHHFPLAKRRDNLIILQLCALEKMERDCFLLWFLDSCPVPSFSAIYIFLSSLM